MLDRPVTSVGRHPHSDVYLDDITVSRRHAQLAISGGVVVVTDLGSLTGTHLNGDSIHSARLKLGDTLHVGKFHLTLVATRAHHLDR